MVIVSAKEYIALAFFLFLYILSYKKTFTNSDQNLIQLFSLKSFQQKAIGVDHKYLDFILYLTFF
jgi:hypothetical protein